MIHYLKNLCQLHFLVVKDGVNAVDSLLGLVRSSPLGFLMQDGNQSPDGHIGTDIRKTCTMQIISFIQSRCGPVWLMPKVWTLCPDYCPIKMSTV